jgi:Domain of unknown function (DUF6538)
MSYLVQHPNTWCLQIRVPAVLSGRYGRLIRQDLQTPDRALAQQLAYQLAVAWLGRFSSERLGGVVPLLEGFPPRGPACGGDAGESLGVQC